MTTRSFLPARTTPLDPPELLRRLRAEKPVSRVTLWNGKQAWLVTRYADASFAMQDRRFSTDGKHPNMPSLAPGQALAAKRWINMLRVDDPKHGELRHPTAPEFTPQQMLALRPMVQRIMDERFDLMLAGPVPVDFVEAIAYTVPTRVVAELVGLPPVETKLYQEYARLGNTLTTRVEDVVRANEELLDALDQLVDDIRVHPRDDLMGRLVAGGQLDQEHLVSSAWTFLIVGHSTTAHMFGLSMYSLLTEPGMFQEIAEHPDLVPGAVEELLRYHSVVQNSVRRVALEDVAIGDTLIRAGDGVIISVSSANRDEAVFPEPDRFDIHRDSAGRDRHLAFGTGPHVCLGQWLSRLEIVVLLETVTRRLPSVRLAVPPGEVPFKDDTAHYGVAELPITW